LGDPANEIGFRIERARIEAGGLPGVYLSIGSAPANTVTFVDVPPDRPFAYCYRVVAFNEAGEATSNVVIAHFGPYVTGHSLDVDSGVSATDQITNDTTPALTFVFDKAVFGTDAAVTVTGPGGGTVTPDSIAGWGHRHADHRVYHGPDRPGPVHGEARRDDAERRHRNRGQPAE